MVLYFHKGFKKIEKHFNKIEKLFDNYISFTEKLKEENGEKKRLKESSSECGSESS